MTTNTLQTITDKFNNARQPGAHIAHGSMGSHKMTDINVYGDKVAVMRTIAVLGISRHTINEKIAELRDVDGELRGQMTTDGNRASALLHNALVRPLKVLG
jgi:hypothetical protein